MTEVAKIAAIICKHLSDALLSAASELSKGDPIITSKDPNFVSQKPDFVSLDIGVFVLFDHTNGNRRGGLITKIDGDQITVENDVLGKTWTISKMQVYYSRIYSPD